MMNIVKRCFLQSLGKSSQNNVSTLILFHSFAFKQHLKKTIAHYSISLSFTQFFNCKQMLILNLICKKE